MTARPEDLAARYAGRWIIYQEQCSDFSHVRWVVDPCQGADGTAEKMHEIESLAEKLALAGG